MTGGQWAKIKNLDFTWSEFEFFLINTKISHNTKHIKLNNINFIKRVKKFQRRIENFTCEKCGAEVYGNGYTDHCPVCLWGKHMDVNPGDRAADCGGQMEPVRVYKKSSTYIIEYICKKCGHKFRVKSARDDDFDALIKLIGNWKL